MSLRTPSVALAACFLVFGALAGGPAGAQEAGKPVTRWNTDATGAKFKKQGDVLRVSASRGRLVTDAEYLDFVLRLDFHPAEEDSEGAVIVRAWAGQDATGYQITLGDVRTAAGAIGTVTHRGRQVRPAAAVTALQSDAASGAGGWQHLEIRCEGDRLSVELNGSVINAVERWDPLAGEVGLQVSRGIIEFRDVSLARLPTGAFYCRERPDFPTGLADDKTPGIVLPRLLHEETPRYSMPAMRRVAQGVVPVKAIVGTDGRVESACVDRGLDQGLDAQAVAAARRWRFAAGRLNGEPVRMVVTIDMRFTLR